MRVGMLVESAGGTSLRECSGEDERCMATWLRVKTVYRGLMNGTVEQCVVVVEGGESGGEMIKVRGGPHLAFPSCTCTRASEGR